ncbi:thermonuclease family protein [Desulfogranum marinum]|jgi:endonuclease YncB( thermonuclease family)|uniref:thermonuclease family protein n=1 Tax=Desulfogranum marinum TaxID=453220 RepID=UPI0029C789AA|nr:thermonuclease family protein [Desulfogranum marinum]
MIIKKHLILAALCILIPAHALCWSGKAITGPNNDTITVERDSEQITIRLYGIKTPELSQAYANQTNETIASLVTGRQIAVNEVTIDEHGQPAALVYISGQILNKHLIQEGYALVDTKNCKENFCNTWISIEAFSRLQGRGMWADKN